MTGDRLRVVFEREKARFAERYPHVEVVELTIHGPDRKANQHGSTRSRDCAWCCWIDGHPRRDGTIMPARGSIEVLHRFLRYPVDRIVAGIRHELGHLADQMQGSERRADEIAEEVGGQRTSPTATPLSIILLAVRIHRNIRWTRHLEQSINVLLGAFVVLLNAVAEHFACFQGDSPPPKITRSTGHQPEHLQASDVPQD